MVANATFQSRRRGGGNPVVSLLTYCRPVSRLKLSIAKVVQRKAEHLADLDHEGEHLRASMLGALHPYQATLCWELRTKGRCNVCGWREIGMGLSSSQFLLPTVRGGSLRPRSRKPIPPAR
jgi:hypothetical protein